MGGGEHSKTVMSATSVDPQHALGLQWGKKKSENSDEFTASMTWIEPGMVMYGVYVRHTKRRPPANAQHDTYRTAAPESPDGG